MRTVLLYLGVLIGSSGCAAVVSHEHLFSGVYKQRTDLTLKIEFSDDPDAECRLRYAHHGVSAPGASVFLGGCALLPKDADLKNGRLPWCIVIVPRWNWQPVLAHEILHCMGYAHESPVPSKRISG